MLSLHSGKCVLSFGVRPAPETPLLLSTMMSVGSIQARLQQRRQRQDRRRGIAAGIGDRAWPCGICVAKQLRQAVGRLAQPLGIGMLVLVPLAIGRGVVQAVVGAEKSITRTPRGQQRLGRFGRRRVRQAKKRTVAALGNRLGPEVFQAQIEPARQRRMNRADVRPPFLPAGERRRSSPADAAAGA